MIVILYTPYIPDKIKKKDQNCFKISSVNGELYVIPIDDNNQNTIKTSLEKNNILKFVQPDCGHIDVNKKKVLIIVYHLNHGNQFNFNNTNIDYVSSKGIAVLKENHIGLTHKSDTNSIIDYFLEQNNDVQNWLNNKFKSF